MKHKTEQEKSILDRDWLYQKYITEDLSVPKISKITGISNTSLYRLLDQYGINKSILCEKLYDNKEWYVEE